MSGRWELRAAEGISPELISEFVRPAMRAVPAAMLRQLGACEISVVERLARQSDASRWTLTEHGANITAAAAGREGHDVALEVLVCVGQVLWETLPETERKAYWLLLDAEIRAGVPGEIDEEALREKELLLSGRYSARSRRRLERYGAVSFAGTAAEYVHSLWHDVGIRTGPRFLPARQLRRRLELLARWYPPDPAHPLFPAAARSRRR